MLTQSGELRLIYGDHSLLTPILANATTRNSYNGFGELTSFDITMAGASVLNFVYTSDNLRRIVQKLRSLAVRPTPQRPVQRPGPHDPVWHH